MADMANMEDVEEAWDRLVRVHGETLVPVTYMNSTAALKAFCGERGGVVCTSSNARRVLEWAWARKARVFFFLTSIWGATPPSPWACRSSTWRSGTTARATSSA